MYYSSLGRLARPHALFVRRNIRFSMGLSYGSMLCPYLFQLFGFDGSLCVLCKYFIVSIYTLIFLHLHTFMHTRTISPDPN